MCKESDVLARLLETEHELVSVTVTRRFNKYTVQIHAYEQYDRAYPVELAVVQGPGKHGTVEGDNLNEVLLTSMKIFTGARVDG